MERQKRAKTGGIVFKLFDIIEDYTRVARDVRGYKGTLIEHAGILNDMSDATSLLSQQIIAFDEKLDRLWDRYDAMESKYIRMLSRLEGYVTSMSAQNAWIQQQMSNSGGSQ
jgi:flagellar hook-associated protein 2